MQHYRFYLVASKLSVDDAQPIEAADDASALATAEKLFGSRPGASGFTLIGPGARIIASRRR